MRKKSAIILFVLSLPSITFGEVLPQEYGLSARFPNDSRIGQAPQVLLAEDFEIDSVSTLKKRWDNVKSPKTGPMTIVHDSPVNGAGKRSVKITASIGENTGGHLYTRLKRGVDTAFARFYAKFEKDPGYIHHFVHFGAYRPATPWPQGGAGTRPKGHERFTVGIEPFGNNGRVAAPGAWGFYAYWHEMKKSADGRYWGNGLKPIELQRVPAGRWQCVEVMIKCNSAPTKRDGELALWLDGKLVAHIKQGSPRGRWTGMGFQLQKSGGEPFEGFSWRKSNDLKINFFWLLHYVTEHSKRRNRDAKRANSVFFDNVVVATDYIGPIKPSR